MPKKSIKKASRKNSPAVDRPDRAERVNLTAWLDPDFKRSIRLIQVDHPELRTQDIIAEGLNLVFQHYGVPVCKQLPKRSR